MALEIRLLGTVEARRDGHLLQIGGGRQHRLLAFLALQPGRARSYDSLLAAVWPDGDLPADPHQTIRTYVSRLRSSLGGTTTIISRDGGYGLADDETTVDARRFEDLLRAAGDPARPAATSLDLLEEALGLWSGSPLDGFEFEDWAQPEAVRLQELRAQAIDDRAQLQLGLGRHAEAVAGLRAAVAADPLRERTRRLLMVSLHRSGRQAEALRTYQDYRRELDGELGLEPGPEIRQLEAAIATGALVAAPEQPQQALRGYRLLEQVGEGSSAVVYRASQPSVHREVAIKVIRSDLADHPEFVRRFEAEAALVARLEHPHIVPLYDFWREPGAAYLVMRWFRGGTLEQHLDMAGCDRAEVVALAAQVGSAVASAHRAGVVHRDIKPANVFLDGEGNYFLGDFGIASDLRDQRAGGQTCGAPASAEAAGPAPDIAGLAELVGEALARAHEPLPDAVTTVLARATSAESPYRSADDFVADLLERLEAEPRSRAEQMSLRNPYKGLRAFQEADAADFFGRRRLVGRVVETIAAGNRFVAVVGPSGSGKSSLVRAGLLPALRSGAAPGSERWLLTAMLPGSRPFEELEVALGRVATTAAARLVGFDADDGRGIARAAKLVAPPDGDVLVVVDQFEELFTLCPAEVRARFIDALVQAVVDPRSHLRVVATLRADFYDRPLRDPKLAPLVETGTLLVTPLAADELVAAIVEPACRVGAELEPGLAAIVAADIRDQPGVLPLLQYALTEVFDRRTGTEMTLAAYEEIGGLGGAVSRRAEDLYVEANESEQACIRRVFTRLVTLGEGTEDTRRRVLVSDLGDAPEVASVMDRYGSARLLSFDRDPQSREATVEFAHEAILLQWPRLGLWLQDDRDGLRLQRDLSARATAWRAASEDPGELYRGGRLETVEQWVADHPDDLTEPERRFLDASVTAKQRELATQRRSVRRIKGGLVLLALLATAAMVAGALAWRQRNRAETAAADAEQSAAAAEAEGSRAREAEFASESGRLAALAPTLSASDPALALLLAVEAGRRAPGPEALGALQQALVGADSLLGFLYADAPLRAVFFDGAERIVGVSSSSVTTWDATTHQQADSRPLPADVRAPVQDGDSQPKTAFGGGVLAWIDPDDQPRFLDLATGTTGTGQVSDGVDSLAVDEAGRRLAVTTGTGQVTVFALPAFEELWTSPGGERPTFREAAAAAGIPPLPAEVDAYAVKTATGFAPDGSTVLSSLGWTAKSLDAVSGSLLASAQLPIYPYNFSFQEGADGRAVAMDDFVTLLLDPRTLAVSAVTPTTDGFPTVDRRVAALTGDRAAVLDGEGELLLVRLGGSTPSPQTVEPHVGNPTDLAVSADGSTLAVAGDEGVALLSANGAGLIRRALPRSPDHIYYVAGRDASWVGTASPISMVPPEEMAAVRSAGRLWRCPAGAPCVELDEPELDPTMELNVEPDRDSLVVLTNDSLTKSSIRIFDGATMQPVSGVLEMEQRVGGFSAMASDRSWAMIWSGPVYQVFELPSGRQLSRIPFEPEWGAAAVSPMPDNDHVMILNPAEGTSVVVDVRTGERSPSPAPQGEVGAVIRSHDGRLAVTTGPSGRIEIRDGSTFEVKQLLATSDPLSWWLSAAFSDDNRFLVTSHTAGGRLWDVETGQLIGQRIPTRKSTAPSAIPGEHAHLITATDEWVQIWDFDVESWAATACKAAGRNLTREEWEQVGPRDQEYRATCPEWPVEL